MSLFPLITCRYTRFAIVSIGRQRKRRARELQGSRACSGAKEKKRKEKEREREKVYEIPARALRNWSHPSRIYTRARAAAAGYTFEASPAAIYASAARSAHRELSGLRPLIKHALRVEGESLERNFFSGSIGGFFIAVICWKIVVVGSVRGRN